MKKEEALSLIEALRWLLNLHNEFTVRGGVFVRIILSDRDSKDFGKPSAREIPKKVLELRRKIQPGIKPDDETDFHFKDVELLLKKIEEEIVLGLTKET